MEAKLSDQIWRFLVHWTENGNKILPTTLNAFDSNWKCVLSLNLNSDRTFSKQLTICAPENDNSKKIPKRIMLLGASNHCSTAAAAAAVAAASKNGTDFSIAAIMSRGSLSREPSERSLSKYKNLKMLAALPLSLSESYSRVNSSVKSRTSWI